MNASDGADADSGEEPAVEQALDEPAVVAGGGIVVDATGRVLVVHRPRYDDWSFPKGKLDPGETVEACALREVLEETGLRCELGAELASARYRDRHGRDKLVRYWAMTVVDGSFEANDEVDEIRWCPVEDAAALLSYRRDAEILAAWAG